jgi:hypothetical protein
MFYTTFEIMTQIILPSRSANAILYYIENKGWFKEYKVGGGYQIPYIKWREETMIPVQKIEVLSALLSPGNGRIYHENGVVHICESETKPFQSRLPRVHIQHICQKHRSAYVLMKYLEEFYYHEIFPYYNDRSRVKYTIPYNIWYLLFQMPVEQLEELGKLITSGYVRLECQLDDKITVDICI